MLSHPSAQLPETYFNLLSELLICLNFSLIVVIKDLLTNYRPVSLLPTSSKLIEPVIRSLLSSYLDGNDLLYPLQSGFRKRHSTATILLRATSDWYWALDNGLYVGVLFLDVTKAFDTVDHNVLISKLSSYGVSSPSLQWFESCLSNHQHSTLIGDANSSTLQVNAGVPQGSVLGPSLFSVLVNDLPSACSLDCTTILFADDTTVYVVVSSVTKIIQTLLSALNNCYDWMSRNLLYLNL